MAEQLKAVLFDFDDTLIDWSGVKIGWHQIEAPHLAQVRKFIEQKMGMSCPDLSSLGELYSQHTRVAWMEARSTLHAPHMPNILMNTLKELGVAVELLETEEVIRAYDWAAVPGTVVFPDVPRILETLRASGIKLGIVTNASQPMSMRDAELEAHGLLDYFPDCRLAAADIGYLKPHPQIFECALERMGTSTAETVFVGDNPTADIAGAEGVGMRAVQRVFSHAGMDSELSESHPCLHSLDGLPAVLDEWYPGWRNSGG